MIHYIKIVWRRLFRNKLFSIINITGLAISLSICFIIAQYVFHELNYDRFISDSSRIVRIIQDGRIEGISGNLAKVPIGLTSDLEKNLSGIEFATEVYPPESRKLTINGRERQTKGIIWTDRNFLNVFDFSIIKGDLSTSILAESGKTIITSSTAAKLFGNKNPIGQSIILDDGLRLEVAAVLQDPPTNFHFSFEMLVPIQNNILKTSQRYSDIVNWSTASRYLYIKSTPGTSPELLQEQLKNYELKNKIPGSLFTVDDLNKTMQESRLDQRLIVQQLTDIYLAENVAEDLASQGNIIYIWIFSILGCLIVIIACINYVNLSMAQGINRIREIGIRKAAGATTLELRLQFLGEAVFVCLLALPLALLIGEFLEILLFKWLQIEFIYTAAQELKTYLIAILIVLITGCISGYYPGQVVSSQNTTNSLKGIIEKRKVGSFRKSLVTFQFVISILLLIATLGMYKQMQFIQTKDLGFEADHLVILPNVDAENYYSTLKDQLQRSSYIKNVSSGIVLGLGKKNSSSRIFMPTNDINLGENITIDFIYVDVGYGETLGLSFISGRDFKNTDRKNSMIMNKKAASILKMRDMSIGSAGSEPFKIALLEQGFMNVLDSRLIGIVEDFHNESIKNEIRPVVFMLNSGFNTNTLVRLTAGGERKGIKQISKTWNSLLPGHDLNHFFLDSKIEEIYRNEENLVKLFTGFSLVSVLIAILGLYGLTTYTIAMRRKEIGIRKVLGAKINDILILIFREFAHIIALGFVIASPIAWYLLNMWLQNFEYKTEIGLFVFILPGFIILLVALLTISGNSFRAATVNPVESIKSE